MGLVRKAQLSVRTVKGCASGNVMNAAAKVRSEKSQHSDDLRKSGYLMDFLVVINESGKVEEVLPFNSFSEAKAEKKKRRADGHKGELVLTFANDLKSLFLAYPEYKPKEPK